VLEQLEKYLYLTPNTLFRERIEKNEVTFISPLIPYLGRELKKTKSNSSPKPLPIFAIQIPSDSPRISSRRASAPNRPAASFPAREGSIPAIFFCHAPLCGSQKAVPRRWLRQQRRKGGTWSHHGNLLLSGMGK